MNVEESRRGLLTSIRELLRFLFWVWILGTVAGTAGLALSQLLKGELYISLLTVASLISPLPYMMSIRFALAVATIAAGLGLIYGLLGGVHASKPSPSGQRWRGSLIAGIAASVFALGITLVNRAMDTKTLALIVFLPSVVCGFLQGPRFFRLAIFSGDFSSKEFKASLAAIIMGNLAILAIFLHYYQYASISISATAREVDGFELKTVNLPESASGLFSPYYAMKARYSYIAYRDRIYERVGQDAWLIRPRGEEPVYYRVEEIVEKYKKGASPHIERSRLDIIDLKTGRVMATRWLQEGQIEEHSGWVGDHAMTFVRSVLVPAGVANNSISQGTRLKSIAAVETDDSGEAHYTERQLTGCPANMKLGPYPGAIWRVLDTGPWAFQGNMHIGSAACIEDLIAVVSGDPLSPDLYILSKQGKLLFQAPIKSAMPSAGAILMALDSPKMTGNILSLHLNYFSMGRDAAMHPVVRPRAAQEIQVQIGRD